MKLKVSKKNTPLLKVGLVLILANKFLENVGFTGIINNTTNEVQKSAKMDTGNLVKAMIYGKIKQTRRNTKKIKALRIQA
ncbi:MAG: hypothetical protein FD183_1338 [Chitinophagaceae bacterium]|nr:MAG: hypothetical protein FD183_1338 [Chitinophagaceae bacterium]